VIRLAIFALVTAGLLTGCGSSPDRQEQAAATVYEGRPVEVLPPESRTRPPPPSREQTVTAPPPATEREAETQPPPMATPRATPRVSINNTAPQFPVAKPVPGKAGFVYSPFESNGTMIDVTGYSSGTKVKDPGTNKIFIVP
jgi:hypothetical protein